MALVLTVDRPRWHQHIDDTVAAFDSQVTAVVKGNGYGFGRSLLFETASGHGISKIAVGTVFELAGTDAFTGEVVALTPSFEDLRRVAENAVITIGSSEQLDHLRRCGYRGRVAVKLQSSMHRHGFAAGELPSAADLADFDVHTFILHLPLAGSDDQHAGEADAWIPALDPAVTISVSHVDATAFAHLRHRHPDRSFTARLGTALWLGDKSTVELRADVLDVHPVRAGDTAGYRATPIPADGSVVLIGAGSAHGVVPLDDGRSPFHFARSRMMLVEAPHMHTSMAFVPAGGVVPQPGDWVDVQRPLTMTAADRIGWTNEA